MVDIRCGSESIDTERVMRVVVFSKVGTRSIWGSGQRPWSERCSRQGRSTSRADFQAV